MRTLTAIGLTALLVTLGACGGGDDDKPQQPVPEVPVTPEPPRLDPLPLVEGPFWPSMYGETFAVSYLDPAPNDAKFRGMLKVFSSDSYAFRKGADSPYEGVDAPCSFDPAGLLTEDPSRPAKATFGDKVFYDPTVTNPSGDMSRKLYRNQFFPFATLGSGNLERAMSIQVEYVGDDRLGRPAYTYAVTAYDASSGWYTCP